MSVILLTTKKKTSLDPLILQTLFTSAKRVEKDLKFIAEIINSFRESAPLGYLDSRSFRGLVANVLKKLGLAGDVSKYKNDLVRLGIAIGVAKDNDTIRVLEIIAGYNAEYVAIPDTIARSILSKEDEASKLRRLAKLYASNIAVRAIIQRILRDIGDYDRKEYDLANITQLAYEALIELANDSSLKKFNDKLANNLALLADQIKHNASRQKKLVNGVFKPLALLTRNNAVEITASSIIVYRSGIEDLIRVYNLDDILKAYCSLLRRAGHDISSITDYGPRIAIRTVAKMLSTPFNDLLEYIIELSKYDKRIIYEKSPLLEGELQHGFRIHKDLLKTCT